MALDDQQADQPKGQCNSHVTKLKAISVEIPECHTHGAQTLDDTEEGVGMEKQFPVDQSVLFDISWFTSHDSFFGLFETQGNGGKDIGDDTDQDHLDVGQDLGETE
jgi:hypothetical protein